MARVEILEPLMARVEILEPLMARVEILERLLGARRDVDAALLKAIAETALQRRPFKATDVLREAEHDAALKGAIEAANIESDKQLGRTLSRIARSIQDGLSISRGRDRKWRVATVVSAVNNDSDRS
jgi:hypothetical protein